MDYIKPNIADLGDLVDLTAAQDALPCADQTIPAGDPLGVQNSTACS